MSLASVAEVIAVLERGQFLTGPQFDGLRKSLQGQSPSAEALLQELVRRSWLTAFQAQQIARGRGAELMLGSYVVLDVLGKGATGQVYRARHQKMQRQAALKVLRPDIVQDAEVVQRFYREIEIVSQISHPNIVHAFEAGPIGPLLVLVMEYVEGPDLEKLVRQSGPLPVERACAFTRQAAIALQHASERGLVHRDIKPGNLLFSQATGLVKILDLGLARMQQPSANGRTNNLTMLSGHAVTQGTPDYMAPEQALDFHSADTRADIYSLGCTLFFLLTGVPPFAGGNLAEKLMSHQQAEPPLAGLNGKVPPGVVSILRQMLAKSPGERFQTPGAVADALTPFASATTGTNSTLDVAGTPTKKSILLKPQQPLPQNPSIARKQKPGSRSQRRIIFAVVGILLMVPLGVLAFLGLGGPSNSTTVAEQRIRPPSTGDSFVVRSTTGRVGNDTGPAKTNLAPSNPAPPTEAARRGKNLVVNPGFEDGLTGWLPVGGMMAVQGDVHSGKFAAQIEGASGGWQDIAVEPNATYTLSAWGKQEGKAFASLSYRLLNQQGDSISTKLDERHFGPAWGEQNMTIRTTADTARIRLTLWHGASSGTLFVDDVSLVKE
jgi:serine/threonine protein kinase